MKTHHLITKTILAGTVMLGLVAGSTLMAEKPALAPPQSHAYGYSLNDWSTMYWEWYIRGGDPTQSKVGAVQLMPLPAGEAVPNTDPQVYRGQLEITVPAGTPIVLPLCAFYGETYNNGNPPDQPLAAGALVASVHPTFSVDGVPMLTEANKAAYYVPLTWFDDPIVYQEPSWYGSDSAIFYEGLTVVIKPLPVGQHTLYLYEPWILDGYWALVYENTWLITVTP